MRLIDADIMRENLEWCKSQSGRYDDIYWDDVIERLDVQPTVDAVPVKHGRWQWLSSTYDRIPCEVRYRCDKCHHETITHGHVPWEKYCPNCGAKMDLEERHDD